MSHYIRKTNIVFNRMTPERQELALKLWAEDKTVGELARTLGVFDATVRRFLRKKGFTDLNRCAARAKRVKMREMLMQGKSPQETAAALQIRVGYATRELRQLIGDGQLEGGKFYQTEYVCCTCGDRVKDSVYSILPAKGESVLPGRFCCRECALKVKLKVRNSRLSVSKRATIGW